jgi:hypothetical protein
MGPRKEKSSLKRNRVNTFALFPGVRSDRRVAQYR